MTDCRTGKVGHATKQDALDALADITRMAILGQRRTDIHGEIAVYPCGCGAWHLTSQPRQPQIVQEG
jgi:hypothetical protein